VACQRKPAARVVLWKISQLLSETSKGEL